MSEMTYYFGLQDNSISSSIPTQLGQMAQITQIAEIAEMAQIAL